MAIKNKKLLIKAISTLENSWGGDTPPEAYWAYSTLVKFLNYEFDIKLSVPVDEEHGFGDYEKEINNL